MSESLPTLAQERETEAIDKAHAVFNAARELISGGMLTAIGYRVMIKPIESIKTLEAAQAEVAPILAERGFETKTNDQKAREQKGENHGVIVTMGPMAYDRLGGREMWCDVGDVVVFSRYAGTPLGGPNRNGLKPDDERKPR